MDLMGEWNLLEKWVCMQRAHPHGLFDADSPQFQCAERSQLDRLHDMEARR